MSNSGTAPSGIPERDERANSQWLLHVQTTLVGMSPEVVAGLTTEQAESAWREYTNVER